MKNSFDSHDLILQFELIEESVDQEVLLSRLEMVRFLSSSDEQNCKFVIDALSMELQSRLTNLAEAAKNYEQCQKFLAAKIQTPPIVEYRYLLALAAYHYRQERTDMGIVALSKALEYSGSLSNPFLSSKIDSEVYHQLGVFYSFLRYYELAVPFFLKVIEMDEKTLGTNNFPHSATLDQIGLSFLGLGDFKGAKSYLFSAKDLKERLIIEKESLNLSFRRESISLAYTLGNIAEYYGKLGDLEQSLEYVNRCIEILIRENDRSSNFAIYLSNAAHINGVMGKSAVAKDLFERNIRFFGDYDSKGTKVQIESKLMYYLFLDEIEDDYDLIGELRKLEQYEEATHSVRARIKYEMANRYLAMNNLIEGKEDLLMSLRILASSRREGFFYVGSALAGGYDRFAICETTSQLVKDNPSIFSFAELKEVVDVGLETIASKIKILPNENDLKMFLGRASVFFDNVLNGLVMFLEEEESAITMSLQISELLRNLILRQQYEVRRLMENGQFNKDTSDDVKEFIHQISLLERSLAITADPVKVKEIKLQLEELNKQYRYLLQLLINDGFRFGKLLNDNELNIHDLLSVCKSDQAIIRYVLTSCSLIVFVVSAGKVSHKVVIDRNESELFVLRDLVDSCIGNLNQTYQDFDEDVYSEHFQKLGEILWQPLEEYLIGTSRVSIVADLWLNNVPFDGIITEIDEELSNSVFLVDKFELDFCSSLQSVIDNNHVREVSIENRLVFLAPRAEEIMTDRKEAAQLKELIDGTGNVGKFLFSDECRKSMVYEMSSEYQILHLSSHGFASEKDKDLCGIKFCEDTYDSTLFPSDIAGRAVHYNLVFLSCCETGLGPIELNEGVLGIYRSFYLSGAENVVYTIFKVPDHGTSELTLTFYKYVYEQGESYTSALAKAKREIRRNKFSTPQSWCGLSILTG